jgi:hypothetical protein
MLRSVLAVASFALVGAALADGPGSRIRTGPGITHPGTPPAAERDAERCYKMPDKEKERCLQRLRAALRGKERAPHAGPGPESTGAGSGAGSGATASGSAGPGAVGGSAPR